MSEQREVCLYMAAQARGVIEKTEEKRRFRRWSFERFGDAPVAPTNDDEALERLRRFEAQMLELAAADMRSA
jgi:hypothetical protein